MGLLVEVVIKTYSKDYSLDVKSDTYEPGGDMAVLGVAGTAKLKCLCTSAPSMDNKQWKPSTAGSHDVVITVEM